MGIVKVVKVAVVVIARTRPVVGCERKEERL
jgi:hypothetical protein